MQKYVLPVLAGLFCLIWLALLPGRLALPPEATFHEDAKAYSDGGVHLVLENFYSLDGETPAFEREPGMSFFISLVYRIFGIENRAALFGAQALLHLLASLFFLRELRKIAPRWVPELAAVFLFLSPGVFHAIYTAYRESFSMSLFLIVSALVIMTMRQPKWWLSTLIGILLGWIILAYIPFALLPFFLIPVLWYMHIPWRHIAVITLIPLAMMGAWVGRNAVVVGEPVLVGPLRTSQNWNRRAMQASTFRLHDPLLCLWAEYISRDFASVSPECPVHPERVEGGPEVEARVSRESIPIILKHLPNHLWISIFYALELHLPYVNGWGRLYNVLEILVTVLMYIGCLLAIRYARRREYLFFLALIVYYTGVCSLIQAVPRYRMVLFFCYAILAGIGYGGWLAGRKEGLSGER